MGSISNVSFYIFQLWVSFLYLSPCSRQKSRLTIIWANCLTWNEVLKKFTRWPLFSNPFKNDLNEPWFSLKADFLVEGLVGKIHKNLSVNYKISPDTTHRPASVAQTVQKLWAFEFFYVFSKYLGKGWG